MRKALRTIRFGVTAWLALCFAASAAGATTFYVKPSGSDSNAGTPELQAWRTIYKACTSPLVLPGDTVLIRAGTYAEGANFTVGPYKFVMWPQKDGSPGNHIVFKGYPGDTRPRIKADTLWGSYLSPSCLYARSWIVFDSLEFCFGLQAGVFLEVTQNCIIRNCVIDSIGFQQIPGENPGGIDMVNGGLGTENILVDNCRFFHINAAAVHIYSIDSLVVRNCTFYDSDAGIFIKAGLTSIATDIHLYDNTFYGTVASGRFFGPFHFAAGTDEQIHRLYFHHNVLYGPRENAMITLNQCGYPVANCQRHDWYIYNNTIDCGGTMGAIENRTADPTRHTNLQIFNNVIYLPSPVGAGMSGHGAFSEYGYVWNACTVGGGRYSSFLEDYNLIYDTISSAHDIFRWYESGVDNAWTLTEWRTNTDDGDNDMLANPLFVSRSSRDYHLLTGSPAATSGRGGVWPTYRGAFAPGASGPDTTKPVITGANETDVTGCNAKIVWQTNEPATSFVDFGLTLAYELGTVSSPDYDYSHSILLANLLPLTPYQYRIRSRDASGNEAVFTGGSFSSTADACDIVQGILPTVSASYTGYSPVVITDGMIDPYNGEATTWASDDGTTTADWVEIDFGSPSNVENLTIHWAWNAFRSAWMTSQQYHIQYWNGSSFDTLTTVNAPAVGNVTSTNLPTTNTQRIRIYQPPAMGPPVYPGVLWVTEVQVFGVAQADTTSPAAVIDLR